MGRVKDSFARCLLGQINLTIAASGLTDLRNHWRREGHQSLEIHHRLQKRWTLYNHACKESSTAERFCLMASLEGLPAVSFAPTFAVSIDEVVVHQIVEETSTIKIVVIQATADKVDTCDRVCTFVDSFVGGRDFLSLGCILETLKATFLAELHLQQSLTDELLCQVSMCFVYCVLLLPIRTRA